jgi:hypothetical protein
MIRALMLGASALVVTAGAASAQTVYVPGYVTPGYAPSAMIAAPPLIAPPAPLYTVPGSAGYYAAPVTVAPPAYGYGPGYAEAVTIERPIWDW